MARRLLIAVVAFFSIVFVLSSVYLVANDEPFEDRTALGVLEGYVVWLLLLVATVCAACVQCLMLVDKDGDILKPLRLRLPILGFIAATFLLGIGVILKLGLGVIGNG
jgi:hypothetical protein